MISCKVKYLILLWIPAGEGNGVQTNLEVNNEVGWYVLGLDQQQIGPYTSAELKGESCAFHLLACNATLSNDLYCLRSYFLVQCLFCHLSSLMTFFLQLFLSVEKFCFKSN